MKLGFFFVTFDRTLISQQRLMVINNVCYYVAGCIRRDDITRTYTMK